MIRQPNEACKADLTGLGAEREVSQPRGYPLGFNRSTRWALLISTTFKQARRAKMLKPRP